MRKFLIGGFVSLFVGLLATAQASMYTDTISIILSGVTSNATVTIPAGAVVRDIIVNNKTNNAVTGGVDIGTTVGGTNVIAAGPIAGAAFGPLPLSTSSVRGYSSFNPQTLYISAASSWNSANVDFVIPIEQGLISPSTILPTIPPGAQAVWNIDQYTTFPRPGIPNSINGTSIQANYLDAPRNRFSWIGAVSTVLYGSGGTVAVTDGSATGPDGFPAATVSASSSGLYGPNISNLLPGTYSSSFQCHSVGTSTQFFSTTNPMSATVAHSCPNSWTTITDSFTIASSTSPSIYFVNATSGAVAVQITNARVYTGATDPGVSTLAGNINLGIDGQSTATAGTYSGGILDMSSNGAGVIQFPNTITVSTFTVTALVNKVVGGAGSGFQTLLSQWLPANSSAYVNFSAYLYSANGGPGNCVPCGVIGPQFANTFGLAQAPGTPFDAVNDGFHFETWTYDGSLLSLWFDGVPLFSFPQPGLSAQQITDFNFMSLNNLTLTTQYQLAGAVGFWNRALSKAEIQSMQAYSIARAKLDGVSNISTATRFWAGVGDSITLGIGSNNTGTSYINSAYATLSPKTYTANWGVSGIGIAYWTANGYLLDNISNALAPNQELLISLDTGANDSLGGMSQSAVNSYITSLTNWYLARLQNAPPGANVRIVGITNTPISSADQPGFNTVATSVAIGIRALNSGILSGVIDFAASSIYGLVTQATSTGQYFDGTHPTSSLQAGPMTTTTTAVINAVP